MPESYTKLFNSLITSTIWTEDDQTRIVWITFLAIADKHGEVQGSIPGIAKVAGVSVVAAEIAIRKFLAPDPYSRTKDEEGRRVEEIPGGWALINHGKYRSMASREDAARKNAERQARFRERRKVTPLVTDSNAGVTKVTPPVTDCNAKVTHDLHIAEADADASGEVSPEPSLPPAGDEPPPAKPPKKRPKKAALTDDEWIASIQADPANAGVDVRRELGRAQFWCRQNRRECSRRFFANWLLKAERTIGSTSNPQQPTRTSANQFLP